MYVFLAILLPLLTDAGFAGMAFASPTGERLLAPLADSSSYEPITLIAQLELRF